MEQYERNLNVKEIYSTFVVKDVDADCQLVNIQGVYMCVVLKSQCMCE